MAVLKFDSTDHVRRNVETHSREVEKAAFELVGASQANRAAARQKLTTAIANEAADLTKYVTEYVLTKPKPKP